MNSEAQASTRSEIKLDKNILKNLPNLKFTNSTDNLKAENQPNYIKVIRRSDRIPKHSRENKYIKEITSPIVSTVNLKLLPNAEEVLIVKKKIISENKLAGNGINAVKRDRKFIKYRFNDEENFNKAFSHDRFDNLPNKFLENISLNLKLNGLKSPKSKKKLNSSHLNMDTIAELNYTCSNVETKKAKASMPIYSSSNIKSSNYDLKFSKMLNVSKKNISNGISSVKKIKENHLKIDTKVKTILTSLSNVSNIHKSSEKNKKEPLSSRNEFIKKKEELLSK